MDTRSFKTRLFGLTGSMGSGKSTVAHFLSQYSGVRILDTDTMAKNILQQGDQRSVLMNIVGAGIFVGDTIRLPAVASIIFSDAEKKERLEAWLHPKVWAEVEREVRAHDAALTIVECALLYEAQWDDKFDAVITATCGEATRFLRLQSKRGFSRDEIRKRLRHQLSDEYKKNRSTFVIDTDCSFEALAQRVAKLHAELVAFQTKTKE